MFFIGATGQLLTLLLTVLLPFVIIISGGKKTDALTKKSYASLHQKHIQLTLKKSDAVDFVFDYAETVNPKITHYHFFLVKIPTKKILVSPRSSCLCKYGNKAPPLNC